MELVFRDKDVVERDGQLLGWRSHGNRTDPLDTIILVSRDFGVVLSEGGVIGYS